jgi:DNA-binding GntR family transcriptional regulator
VETPDVVRGSSYVSVAYHEVRARILSGDLAPGTRVTVRPLADSLELSPTPIRTALAALERQGLLEVHEHRGYFVPLLGRDDLLEIYELREAVDGIASRRAARSEDRERLVTTLEDLLERQRASVDVADLDTYAELDVAFHRAIWQGSNNRQLASLSENLLGQVRIGNNISVRAPGRPQIALQEHATIVDAIRRGDAPGAERATRTHVRKASRVLAQLLA